MDLQAWSVSSLGSHALLLASCPGTHPFGRAAAPAEQVCFDQELLGYGAQLRLFAALLRQAGRTLHVVAAPEIFSGEASFRRLAELAGHPSVPDDIVHFRFGMTHRARLLKHATNVMVCSEQHMWAPLGEGWHPFGDGQTLPHGFAQTLAVHPGLPAPRGFGKPPCRPLLLDLLEAATDAQNATQPQTIRLADYDAARFWQPGGAALPDTYPKRALHIMVPWNLGFPASVVPDLLLRLTKAWPGEAENLVLTLFPYNWQPECDAVLERLARQVRNADKSLADRFWVARVATGPAAGALGSRYRLAWIEEADPERLWLLARLDRLNVPTALIRSLTPARPARGRHRFVVSTDRHRLKIMPDWPGAPAGLTGDFSTSAARRLLRCSLQAAA